MELLSAWNDHFNTTGCLVAEHILPPADIQTLCDAADHIFAHQTDDKKYTPEMDPYRIHPTFRDILKHTTLVPIIKSLLGTDSVDALQSLLYFKPPRAGGRDPHQENFYHRSERGVTLTVWIPLDKADQENGGLFVYPGSHQEKILPIIEDQTRRKTETDANGLRNDRGLPCFIPDTYKKQWIIAEPGSVVFIHNHTIHGSDTNMSTRTRRSHSAVYIKKDRTFIQANSQTDARSISI